MISFKYYNGEKIDRLVTLPLLFCVLQKCYAAFNIQSDYSGIPTLPTSLLGENNGHNRGDRAASDQLPSNVKLYSPTDPVVDFEPLSPFQPLVGSEPYSFYNRFITF